MASCQRYSDGFWAAHRDLAAADVDLVLFLGDFVYETATPGIRMLPGQAVPEPAADLEGYRLRYEAARSDPDLAACAAAHPWVVTWDDHEVASNYDGPTVNPELRSAAYQAWWEHQPTRVPPPQDGELRIARTVRWGRTATLVVLDTRQHRVVGETVLGAEQRAWALEEIGAATTAWTVLGSSIVFSPVVVGEQINPDALGRVPDRTRRPCRRAPARTRSTARRCRRRPRRGRPRDARASRRSPRSCARRSRRSSAVG